MQVILLPIKPIYVKEILNKKKIYEFRKSIPTRKIDRIIIYSSSPTKAIVGEAKVIDTIKMEPKKLWKITKEFSGISYKKYLEYFKDCKYAYAYHLGEIIIYERSKSLIEFNIRFAPQSFIYINQ